MSYIQCTCIIIYTNFLVVHLLHHNNYYVGSVKLLDQFSVSADICMHLSAIGQNPYQYITNYIYNYSILHVSSSHCKKKSKKTKSICHACGRVHTRVLALRTCNWFNVNTMINYAWPRLSTARLWEYDSTYCSHVISWVSRMTQVIFVRYYNK